MTSAGLTLYWTIIVVATAAALALTVAAWRLRKATFTISSAVLVAMVLAGLTVPTPGAPTTVRIILGILVFALAVLGGNPVAALVLHLATRGSVPPGSHGGILVDASGETERRTDRGEPGAGQHTAREVLRGGLTIGILERVAVAGSILSGYPAAIAVLVAIKGVGRFSELDAAEARERFIIGTLASLIWASGCSAIVILAAAG